MKQLKALLELLPRKTLAVMFACLFMLQGMGLFHAAMAANIKSSEISIGSKTDDVALTSAASEHCDKDASDMGPLGGHCSHVGFCPLCSLASLDIEGLTRPAPTALIAVISLHDLALPQIVVDSSLDLPPTSVGFKYTYSSIAPPRI